MVHEIKGKEQCYLIKQNNTDVKFVQETHTAVQNESTWEMCKEK